MSTTPLAVSVTLALSLPAGAQQPAPFGALQQLEIAGNRTFERPQILVTLAMDPRVMSLLGGRSAPDATELAESIASRIRDGYRFSGFADVEVDAVAGADGHRVEIDEGARSRCGEVRITGNTTLATDALRAALRHDDSELAWRAGEFARFDAAFLPWVEKAMVSAYREAGRRDVRVQARHARDAGLAHLAIEVEDEGREVRVRGIDLLGETDAARDIVLDRLQWPPGSLLTGDRLRQLRSDLEALGRYRSISIVEPEDPSDETAALAVTVQVLPDAPAPDAAFARDARQAQAGLQSLAAHLHGGGTLRATLSVDEPLDLGILEVLPGSVTIDVAGGGVVVRCDHVRIAGEAAAPGLLAVTSRSVALVVGDAVRAAHAFDRPVGVTLRIDFVVSESGELQFSWQAGINAEGGADLVTVNIGPGFAAALVSDATAMCRRDGEDLLLGEGDEHVRIGPAGEIETRSVRVSSPGRSPFILELRDTTLETEAGAAVAPAAEPRRLAGGFAAMGIAALERRLDLTRGRMPEAAALLRSSVAWLLAPPAPGVEPPAGHPRLLAPPTGQTQAQFIAGMLAAGAVVSERCPWLSALLASGWGLTVGGESAGDALRALGSMADDPRYGPIALSIAIGMADIVGQPRLVEQLLAARRQRASIEAIHGDVVSLLAAFEWSSSRLHRLVAHWRADSELAGLFTDPPTDDIAAGDRAALRQALLVLWESPLGTWVRDQWGAR